MSNHPTLPEMGKTQRYQVGDERKYGMPHVILDTAKNSEIVAASMVRSRALSLAARLNAEADLIDAATELREWALEVPVGEGEPHEKVIASRLLISRLDKALNAMKEASK